jgi:hypothetical protein
MRFQRGIRDERRDEGCGSEFVIGMGGASFFMSSVCTMRPVATEKINAIA